MLSSALQCAAVVCMLTWCTLGAPAGERFWVKELTPDHTRSSGSVHLPAHHEAALMSLTMALFLQGGPSQRLLVTSTTTATTATL